MSSTSQFLTAIGRPRCSRCQVRMMLERVSFGPIGVERRLFECPKCDQVEMRVIASRLRSSAPDVWLSQLPASPKEPHQFNSGAFRATVLNEVAAVSIRRTLLNLHCLLA